jgi:hypothetical protein
MVQTVVLAALVAAVSVAAQASPIVDTFSIRAQGANLFVEGGGSGWEDGTWVYYPDTAWWNQWFYNAPPDPLRWKVISYDILITPDTPISGYVPATTNVVEIALNWSALGFPETGEGGPPPMAGDEPFIVRDIAYQGWQSTPLEITGTLLIPDFNPEWVSIDVSVNSRQYSATQHRYLPLAVTIQGTVEHECLPEPATIGFLVLGGLGLMVARRRAK